MSLADYSQACPYLHSSDRITLHPDFSVRGSVLLDKPLAAQHAAHANSIKVLRALSEGLRYDQFQAIAARVHLDSDEVSQLLGFLNTAGAIRYRQTIHGRLAAAYHQLTGLLIGISYAPKVWRWPPSAAGLLRAALHAGSPVLLASVLVACVIAGSGLHGATDSAAVLAYGCATICCQPACSRIWPLVWIAKIPPAFCAYKHTAASGGHTQKASTITRGSRSHTRTFIWVRHTMRRHPGYRCMG